jgi:glucoside 3-dehydrogenase (cytochrome c) catalytic subunit
LLRSSSSAMPNGMANTSGALGRYIMDHASTLGAVAVVPGFESHYYYGNRPTGIIIPRFVNLDNRSESFARGYSFQGGAYRAGWTRGKQQAGLGADFKNALRGPGDWKFVLTTFAECLPRHDNRLTLDPKRTDADGAPQLKIDMRFGENERKLLADAKREAAAMIAKAGARVLFGSDEAHPPGSAIHEMGGARMGRDPATSVLNRYNQAHDIPNLFVTDGAAMSSSACQNPSLTYMALTARAAATAADLLADGSL